MVSIAIEVNWGVVCVNNLCVLFHTRIVNDNTEVYLEKYPGLRVSNLFVDPTGNHLFIALTTTVSGIVPELLYLHRKSHKPKKVEKFRDHEITAVAFNHLNKSESSTGSILIGTSKGLIFETELGMEGEKMFQSCWKQVSWGCVLFSVEILLPCFFIFFFFHFMF